MDPYQKKLSEMKGYVPFLDKMISRLEKVKDGTKDQQLSKMKDLLKVSIVITFNIGNVHCAPLISRSLC